MTAGIAPWRGNVISDCADCVCNSANGIANVDDILAEVYKFQAIDVAPITWLIIDPSMGNSSPNQTINVNDILGCVDAFPGKPYPALVPLNSP